MVINGLGNQSYENINCGLLLSTVVGAMVYCYQLWLELWFIVMNCSYNYGESLLTTNYHIIYKLWLMTIKLG